VSVGFPAFPDERKTRSARPAFLSISREAVRIEPRYGGQINHPIRGKERIDHDLREIGECRPAGTHAEQRDIAGMTARHLWSHAGCRARHLRSLA
jgi:hypothetical protein